MKTKILFFLLIAVAIRAVAETTVPAPITIGILTFGGPHRTRANNIVSLLTANLSADDRFSLVSRDELKKILDEQSLGRSGNVTPESAARIGMLTGAKVLVTGRELNGSKQDEMVIIANVIGSENGRVFSMTVRGQKNEITDLMTNLASRISETITVEATNLIPAGAMSHDKRIAEIVKQVQGKMRPAVSINIKEQVPRGARHETADTELGLLFQKAGFSVVDEKSEKKPDVIITGDAMFAAGPKRGDICSGRAIINLKAQERVSGKILSLDRADAAAADVSNEIAAQQAVQNAADDLGERLLPQLAQ